MVEVPETRYVKTADGVHIAYQTVGDGPLDIVFSPAWYTHLDLAWESVDNERTFRRLASFGSRLILFDRRGSGLSDRVPLDRPPTLEQQADDVLAVLDAVGSRRAALIGIGVFGSPLAIHVAATYPERVVALVLYNATARQSRAPDHPIGVPPEALENFIAGFMPLWGTNRGDDVDPEWGGRYQRAAMSPGAVEALLRAATDFDVRQVLPAVRIPTLVLHSGDNHVVRIEQGRYVADRISDARFVDVPFHAVDVWMRGALSPEVLDEIEEFLTGERQGPELDRSLATVLFSDIVGSTGRAAELGDRPWRDVLDRFYELTARQISRFRGRQVKTTGDGVLATFDGPARAVRCAQAITSGARGLELQVRSGLHTGEIEHRGEDISGIAVHLAQRVCSLAGPGEVFVSRTVVDLVTGSGIEFSDRGERELRGVPGNWRLFTVHS